MRVCAGICLVHGIANFLQGLDEISRCLYQMKVILYGDLDNDPVPDQIALLAQEVYASDVLVPLVSNLQILEFDSRKDVVVIFTTLLRRQIGSRSPTVDYLSTRTTIFDSLISWSANPDLALTAGAIIRDCIKYETLASIILNSPMLWNYFEYVNSGPFEITTDSFATIHDLFSLHPTVVSDFLARNSSLFASRMNGLMKSDNYVTKRQSVKLMAQIIRQRSNFLFMSEYISNPENLKQVMNLLRDKSKNIQYEAFHIFKVFVANPKKSKPISDILMKNKVRLLNFLQNFNPEKKDDEAFKDEKAFIIKQITALPTASRTPASSSPSAQTSAQPSASTTPEQVKSPEPNSPSGSSMMSGGVGGGGGPSILTPAPSVPPPVVHAEPVHSYFPDQQQRKTSASGPSSSPVQNFHHPLPKLPTH